MRSLGYALMLFGAMAGAGARAADPDGPAEMLDQVVVLGRGTDLVGEADSPSEGVVGASELADRPFLRRGELLEAIPGVIITQHSGDGKANQYFLRGFNLDHGTDFATSVDGMPVNLPSHAHGQGYSDLNFIIPEFVQSIAYEKGVYFPENGDFSAAGAAQFHLADSLPEGFAKLETGSFGYVRAVAGESVGGLTLGGEVGGDNGPWTHPEHAIHESGYMRKTWTAGDSKFAVTVLGYDARWNSTDQVPQRAIDEGLIPRYGAIDPSDGGTSSRESVSFTWQRDDAAGRWRAVAYGVGYRLNLFSDFTYFLVDPVHGDQFEQQDRRGIFGGGLQREWNLGPVTTTVGLDLRADTIALGLFHTEQRMELAPVELDSVHEDAGALWMKSVWHPVRWVRVEGGARLDGVGLDDNAHARAAGLLSPKAALILGPWEKTEVYLDAGDGFHSNDARGAATPLARAEGGEAGVRTEVLPGWVSTVSCWALDLASELTFDGDTGETDANGPTRRYGVEWANFYRLTPEGLTVDADLACTHARYRAATNGGLLIANSIGTVMTGGLTQALGAGCSATVRARYFGPQPIVENGSRWEPSSLTWNARLGWKRARWEVALDVLNVFDRANEDIAYDYVSRLPGEPAAGQDDVHLHPGEPRELRGSITRRF